MDKNGVRIISLEASEIYKQIYNNGEAIRLWHRYKITAEEKKF